jgi:hypothetical protein
MVSSLREKFNAQFTEEKYQRFLEDLYARAGMKIFFRVAESPVFFSKEMRLKFEEAGESIIQSLMRNDLKEITEAAIPQGLRVPNEDNHSLFLALDFAVCLDEKGELIPQLIELQGFPSLFAFQDMIQQAYVDHFDIPNNYSVFFNGLDSASYRERLKKLLLNGHEAKHVILLEIEPEKQSTSVDFVATKQITGIEAVCITKVIREGQKLYYMLDGEKTEIKRIYNRVIFDEFTRRTDLNCQFNLTEDVDAEWAGHPNWFFRISKFLMPHLDSKFVPKCQYLSDVQPIPNDLENYVLKPLFSFSGTGVIFHVKPEDIDAIPMEERKNFLLQRKVVYEPVLQAPDGKVKIEVRLLYFHEPQNARPELVVNLGRLSRGEMIGVKFNKDKTWVGGNVSFFEK